jgi:F0F1-type ATP synthase membrane subunit b/b'
MAYFSIFLIRIILFGLFLFVTWSQVIIPAYKGTRLFPIFNSRRNKVNKEIEDAQENLEILELEDRLKILKDRQTTRTSKPPTQE